MKPSTVLLSIGIATVVAGIGIIALTFLPLTTQEIKYATHAIPKTIVPVDQDFGIVIPKLGANAHVIANVNPYDSRAYEYALTKGVAHAKGTSMPGDMGNMFLFAHSSENFYVAMQYNSVFYLINKLENGDEIDVYWRKTKYVYAVTGKKFVGANAVSYLTSSGVTPTLTLMTCWPPGTNSTRLLVFGELKRP